MVKKEFYMVREDGVTLYRTYSTDGKYLKQQPTGIEYAEAVDVENAPYWYIETDKPIPEPPQVV